MIDWSQWNRGGPLDRPPTVPPGSPYQDYVDDYRRANDEWYSSFLDAPPPITGPMPAPTPIAAPPTPAGPPPAPMDPFSGGGDRAGGGFGSFPGGGASSSLGSLGGVAGAPVTSVFDDTSFVDLEPGMFGMFGTSIGTGLTELSPYGQLHDVAMIDPAQAVVGLATSPLGPLGSLIAGEIAGALNPLEVPLGSLGNIGSVIDVLSAPSEYSSSAVGLARRGFAQPPQLDLRGGPMEAAAKGAAKAAPKGGGIGGAVSGAGSRGSAPGGKGKGQKGGRGGGYGGSPGIG